jgi:hypothetical protein
VGAGAKETEKNNGKKEMFHVEKTFQMTGSYSILRKMCIKEFNPETGEMQAVFQKKASGT